MSTRKPSPRNRSLRPAAEDLETRQLLSGVVSGTDIDGDTWTLRLIGPGSLTVTKQNGADGNPAALDSDTEINSITVAGTNPTESKLIGQVTQQAGGNGLVYFQNMNELGSRSEKFGTGNGLLAISMPNFWLANTTPTDSSTTAVPPAPTITIPDGTNSLRFGGVDTTHDQLVPLPSGSTDDVADVVLGLPLYGGTKIIINKSISSDQTLASTTAGGTPTIVQHAVEFNVSGRLDLFQADEIDGDATTPPGYFEDDVLNPTATGLGGTFVVSGTSGTAPFFPTNNNLIQGGLTGQIGNVRIGGNATNFATLVFDSTGSGNAKITNFSVGGETDNVLVIAPNGGQSVAFGQGMDTVTLDYHVLNNLQANRGALNSRVLVDRTLSKATFGGDVVNTQVQTGLEQNFTSIIETITGTLPNTSILSGSPPPAPVPTPENAQIGGGMTVLVAGDVTDSVFTASVEPNSNPAPIAPDTGFGETGQLVLPTGHIKGKIEGTINNTNATPSTPNKAFYAQQVDLLNGPVAPPNIPEAPYSGPARPTSLPGINHLNNSTLPLQAPTAAATRAAARAAASAQTTQSVPAGPRAASKK